MFGIESITKKRNHGTCPYVRNLFKKRTYSSNSSMLSQHITLMVYQRYILSTHSHSLAKSVFTSTRTSTFQQSVRAPKLHDPSSPFMITPTHLNGFQFLNVTFIYFLHTRCEPLVNTLQKSDNSNVHNKDDDNNSNKNMRNNMNDKLHSPPPH